MDDMYDYIVIGAGAAGLSFTALMEKKGYKVALLEAHSLPGGCASYFERNGNIFDAGATTLSGLKAGRPLQKLINELNLDLEIKKIDPGLISVLNNKSIRRFSNQDKWLSELQKNYPSYDHHPFWTLVNKIDEDGWELSSHLENIPFRSLKDVLNFRMNDFSHSLKLLPYFLKSVASYLRIKDKEYISMMDEMLFITSQNNSIETPMLMGAMGLNYPTDTGYAIGGMKAFVQALAQKCSRIFYRHQVISIKAIDNGFHVQTNKAEFHCKKIVSTLPLWNHEKLFENDEILKKYFSPDQDKKIKDCWSAFMIYLTVPLDQKRESLYYQIHTDPIPNCGTHSFFVSFSHPDDHTRTAQSGRQTVTISTHTKPEDWMNLSRNEYKAKKEETSDFILKYLLDFFSIDQNEIEDVTTGSPSTFIRYTRRYAGLVGGIPHSIRRNPLKLVSSFPPLKNFYMIGDTQFPGQGVAAVVLGTQNLVKQLSGDND